MTTPTPPPTDGYGNPIPAGTGYQPMPGQAPDPRQFAPVGAPGGYGAYAPPPQPPAARKPRNTVGIIAVAAAVIGFVFACIPGALIIGWILLPIAFILGLVGLFGSGAKGTAIAAVVISIVGTIVGALVFFTVLSDAVDDAFGTDDTVSAVGPDGKPVAGDDEPGSQATPAPLGTTLSSGDWEVTLNSFDPDATREVLAANSFNDDPAAGNAYGLANITVTYTGDGSGSTFDLSFAYVSESGNVLNSYDNDAVAPEPHLDGELYNGASLTGNVDFEIPQNESGLLRVRMGTFGNEVFFSTR
ncbi:DUF4352 domain-containing protein [Gordonia caeni]|uniref:DUF4352 domain-containing protein n=1 Tax=Gordonia caeni TaxID=1007097 RepID=A0ABP7NKR4_9ACTN